MPDMTQFPPPHRIGPDQLRLMCLRVDPSGRKYYRLPDIVRDGAQHLGYDVDDWFARVSADWPDPIREGRMPDDELDLPDRFPDPTCARCGALLLPDRRWCCLACQFAAERAVEKAERRTVRWSMIEAEREEGQN
jgi:hypothetical protein